MSHYGILSPDELRQIRRRAGLSVRAVAHLVGFAASGERTIRRLERGELEPSGPVTLLYRLLSQGRLGPEVTATKLHLERMKEDAHVVDESVG